MHLSWLTWCDQRQPLSDMLGSFTADMGMYFIREVKFEDFDDPVFVIKLTNISKGKTTQRNDRGFKS